jgi:hypothetical protein
MNITIKGLLVSISPKQNYKRGPVVQVRISEDGTGEQLPVDFYGEKITLIEAVKAGQTVAVTADIIGRSYPGGDGATKYLAVLNGLTIALEAISEKNVTADTVSN